MNEETINSKEYWNKRFNGDWDESAGRLQTKFFTYVLMHCLPKEIREDIIQNRYSIGDVSGGEGDSLPIFHEEFHESFLRGYDFSESAIEHAQKFYPEFDFAVADIFSSVYPEDVLFCSNTLEHFEKPWSAFDNLTKSGPQYIFILIPFMEAETMKKNDSAIEEHVSYFDYENIPDERSGYNLIHYCAVDTMGICWPGYQILLVYAPDKCKKSKRSIEKEVIAKQLEIPLEISIQRLSGLFREYNDCLYEAKLNFLYSQIHFDDERKHSADLTSRLEAMEEEKEKMLAVQHAMENHIANISNSIGYKILRKGYAFVERHKTIRAIGSKAKQVIQRKKQKKHEKALLSYVKNILNSYKGEYVFLFQPLIEWHVPLFQRPQQIARSLGKAGILYFYSTANVTDHIDIGEEVSKNCYVLNVGTSLKKIAKLISKKGKKLLYNIYSTDNWSSIDWIKENQRWAYKTVYEYIDAISEEISGNKIPLATYQRHNYLIHGKDVAVIASADKLYKEVKKEAPNKEEIALVTNGVDLEHFIPFGAEGKLVVPPELEKIVSKSKPIIGYYGALATWTDTDLIAYVAEQRPDYEYVLIGPRYHDRPEFDELDKLPNVHLLGTIHYNILPQYAHWFDVATIPFVVNEISESTSPIKLFEYMALEKPIVTTDMPECAKYKSVMVAKSYRQYVQMLDQALERKDDSEYLTLLRKEAQENSWDHKAIEIMEILGIEQN